MFSVQTPAAKPKDDLFARSITSSISLNGNAEITG